MTKGNCFFFHMLPTSTYIIFLRYEIPEFQQKVRKCFDKLYDASYWQKIDANHTEDDLTKMLAQYAEETIDSSSNEPLKYLW